MHKRRLVSILIALIAVAAISGLIYRNNQRAEKRFNVLLITLDTTRADRLGCYGYDNAETPTLDALAAHGVLFENAYSPVPLTLPSHATIMTGLNPPEHGLHENGRASLGPAPAVLAEIFQDRGYRTAAFPAAFVLDKLFGLSRGFDHYDDRMGPLNTGTATSASAEHSNPYHQENPGDIITDRVVSWLGESSEPFFAWAHFYDPHWAYSAPEPYKSRHSHPYDGEIAFMDSQINRLLECLDDKGLRENTLIVVAGDHGESLGEHQEQDHGALIYNATLRVPLILNMPGQLPEGESRPTVAGLIDVAATILDVLNWPRSESIGGQSLLNDNSGSAERSIYSESEWLMNRYGWAPLYSLQTERWKFIEAPVPELYDCQADPGELKNLVAIENAVAVKLSARLDAMLGAMKTGQAAAVALGAKDIARLESLGYLAGSQPARPASGLHLDPKKMMPIYNGCREAKALQALSKHQKAVRLLLHLIEQSPESLELLKTIVISYVELDELVSARPHAEAYLQQDPYERNIIGCLAGAFVQSGNLAQAEALYRDALRLPARPDEPVRSGAAATSTSLQRGLGQVLEMQNKLPEAAEQYEIYLKQVPEDTLIRSGLTKLYFTIAKYDAAKTHLLVALRNSPLNPKLHRQMGQILYATGDHDGAISYYSKAIALNPAVAGASLNLAFILSKRQQYGDAIAVWRQGLEHLPAAHGMAYLLAFSLASCPDAKHRNGAEALVLATALCEQTQHANSQFLDALAAAHAETGSFPKAIEIAGKAVEIAKRAGDAGLAREIAARLKLYEAGKAFRTKRTVISEQ